MLPRMGLDMAEKAKLSSAGEFGALRHPSIGLVTLGHSFGSGIWGAGRPSARQSTGFSTMSQKESYWKMIAFPRQIFLAFAPSS
jgi:hypothetical protein